MNKHIFREYDVRGVVDKDLTEDVVTKLGKGIGTYLRRQGVGRVTIGRDGRDSSPRMRDYLAAGLKTTGMDVIDLGMIPTPVSYFSNFKLDTQGSIMITGSHNPPDYNGFKITSKQMAIYGDQIMSIYEIIENGDYETGDGKYSEQDILDDYIADLASNIKLARNVRVGIDPGNGVGSLTAGKILRKIGCEVHEINAEVDGTFPNHHPDPTVEANLAQLKELVREQSLELGVAYDGDADRIGIVDEKGNVIWGDQILAILARDILEVQPGAMIIGEVKCSRLFFEDVEKHGGKPVMWKVGHSLIKSKMLQENAPLAGEMSGHIFFKHRFYGFDDAVYVTGRFLEIVAKKDIPVSQFLADWTEVYNTPEIRIDCPDEIKFEVVAKVRDHFKNKYDVIDVDGMRVNVPGGWGLLRPSNTQPVVVLRFEAESEERLIEIKNEVEDVLKQTRDSF